VNVVAGQVTNEPVATALSLPFVEVANAFG
jgi:hypothetical protein